MSKKEKWGVHRRTGFSAMLQVLPDGLCLAQFDNMQHRHAYGWSLYLRREFTIGHRFGPKEEFKQ